MKKTPHEREVLLYPSVFKLHTSYRTLLHHPPQGYRFMTEPQPVRARFLAALRTNTAAKAAYHLFVRTFKSKALFDMAIGGSASHSENISLVFSMSTLYKGTLPYVIEILDNPFSIAGYNYAVFMKNKKAIERGLASPLCKRIICTHETLLKFMKEQFSKGVRQKCVLVRNAVEECTLPRIPHEGFRLLFVGSTTNPDDFYTKGGLEALQTFEQVSKSHNVSLTIRCKIPPELAERIRANKKITVIEQEIPFQELQQLYLSSDALIFPAHHFHLMAMLEAMSMGLPIVALDTYAVGDFVEDGVNGFLVRKSDTIRGYDEPRYPTNVKTREFLEDVKRGDKRVIDELSEKVIFLAKHPRVLRRASMNSRKIARDRFSTAVRNRALKKIFDEALAQPQYSAEHKYGEFG